MKWENRIANVKRECRKVVYQNFPESAREATLFVSDCFMRSLDELLAEIYDNKNYFLLDVNADNIQLKTNQEYINDLFKRISEFFKKDIPLLFKSDQYLFISALRPVHVFFRKLQKRYYDAGHYFRRELRIPPAAKRNSSSSKINNSSQATITKELLSREEKNRNGNSNPHTVVSSQPSSTTAFTSAVAPQSSVTKPTASTSQSRAAPSGPSFWAEMQARERAEAEEARETARRQQAEMDQNLAEQIQRERFYEAQRQRAEADFLDLKQFCVYR